jgi:hypothetical protein
MAKRIGRVDNWRIGRADEWRDYCKARYEAATKSVATRPPAPKADLSSQGLYQHTGDPLFLSEPELAAATYGLKSASRPNVQLRRVSDAIFGSGFDAIVDLARELRHRPRYVGLPDVVKARIAALLKNGQTARAIEIAKKERPPRWSAVRAAQEAVALASERGTWLGKTAPVGFDDAVKRVRKALGGPPPDHSAVGHTGRWLRIVPAPGQPACLVPDTLHWRRREAGGDVVVLERVEKKNRKMANS